MVTNLAYCEVAGTKNLSLPHDLYRLWDHRYRIFIDDMALRQTNIWHRLKTYYDIVWVRVKITETTNTSNLVGMGSAGGYRQAHF